MGRVRSLSEGTEGGGCVGVVGAGLVLVSEAEAYLVLSSSSETYSWQDCLPRSRHGERRLLLTRGPVAEEPVSGDECVKPTFPLSTCSVRK